VAGAVGALLTWALAVALWRARARRRGTTPPDAADRRWLLAAIAAAVLSHLVLDWTNDYGVHPFWPVDVAWRYGDAVFIIEPWLWVAAVPALFVAARRGAARAALAFVLAVGLALAWLLPLVPWGAAAALTAGAAASLAAARRLAPGPRIAFALGAWAAVELAFFAGTGAVRRHVAAAARATDPGARVADVILTPAPANPFCGHVIVVEAAGPGGATYRLTTAWATAAPSLVPAERCRPAAMARGSRSLPMTPSPRPASAAVGWDRTWQAPLAELQALARGNCQAAAVLRFARAPFWRRIDTAAIHIGDLRYARGPDLGFAEVVVPVRPGACPRAVPPWRPPRADLIGTALARGVPAASDPTP
jgi:inner membrane protein